MQVGWIVVVIVLAALASLVLYWQLVVAEGAYLGTRVVALLYDWFAPRYDQVKQYDKSGDALMLAAPVMRHLAAPHPRPPTGIFRLSQGERGDCVLDIATGTGRLPEALLSQPRFKGRITAIDASAKMLGLAQQKLSPHSERITFMQHDAQQLPFEDGTFDAVTCVEALEFMRNGRAAVREMLRVLRPGGLLIVSNRIGPDAWKLPGRAVPTAEFVSWLHEMDLQHVESHTWLVDYDLVTGIKSASFIHAGATIESGRRQKHPA